MFIPFVSVFVFVFVWPHLAACGILVPRPGMEPEPPVVGVPLDCQGSPSVYTFDTKKKQICEELTRQRSLSWGGQ